MAKYYMIAFNDLGILSQAGQELGYCIYQTLMEKQDKIRSFPMLQDDFEQAAPPQIPVAVSSVIVGQFLGKYYDAEAVGATTKPAIIPPQSVVCIISSTQFERLLRINGEQLADDLLAYKQDPTIMLSQDDIMPVFVNDTDEAFPLHILRKFVFSPTNADKIRETRGGPTLDQEYEAPRFASLA